MKKKKKIARQKKSLREIFIKIKSRVYEFSIVFRDIPTVLKDNASREEGRQ